MTGKFMTIDNIPVELTGEEKNLLEVIRRTGIELPTFCYYSELSVYGACRMCMVEDDRGNIHAACSTPPKAGMTIYTNTSRLRKYRRNILELLLANHCRDCTTCEKSSDCKLQQLAQRFHITGVRFPNAQTKPDPDCSSPCISIDHSKCILCGDCVRMCNEVQHVGAIDFAYRGAKMVVSPAFGRPMAESGCVGCGSAITGAGASCSGGSGSACVWPGGAPSPSDFARVKMPCNCAGSFRMALNFCSKSSMLSPAFH